MSKEKIQELRKSITDLTHELQILETKSKKKKGVLKEGEWFLLEIFEYDENDKIKELSDTVIFYRTSAGTVCMNAYIEWYTEYVDDLLKECPYYEKWVGKKITKDQAICFL